MADTTKAPEDECMEFFDDIFNCIMPSYRKIEVTEEINKGTKSKKQLAKADKPARSLFEIGEAADAKISLNRQENAAKSLAKIKELTIA